MTACFCGQTPCRRWRALSSSCPGPGAVDCAACGCPEAECMDVMLRARAAGEEDECCAECSHVYAPVQPHANAVGDAR